MDLPVNKKVRALSVQCTAKMHKSYIHTVLTADSQCTHSALVVTLLTVSPTVSTNSVPVWASMVAILLMALFQRFWRWLTVISRTKRLMMDVSSSVGEVVMLGAGSIELRAQGASLLHYSKIDNFSPTPVWTPSPADDLSFSHGWRQ